MRLRYKALQLPVQWCDSSPNEPFSRGASRNAGVASCHSEYVLIADADTIVPEHSIRESVRLLSEGSPWVIAYAEERYYNLSQEYSDYLLMTDPATELDEPDSEDKWEHKITSWAGAIVMRKLDFLSIGGYDESYRGWGWEDNDFQIRADAKLGKHDRVDGFCVHIWHPASRESTWDQPHARFNQRLLRQTKRIYGAK